MTIFDALQIMDQHMLGRVGICLFFEQVVHAIGRRNKIPVTLRSIEGQLFHFVVPTLSARQVRKFDLPTSIADELERTRAILRVLNLEL
ncbi:hypothetical protein D3C72_1221570 [compost metagenome]